MSSFGSATPRNEERRGKVAALLKQQGVGVKDMTKSVPVNKEVPPLFDRGGEMKVWRIDGSAQTLLPKEDFGKSYSGDCYIVRYTYPAGDREKGYFECCWFGKDSIEGRIFQGEEPPQFVKLFQPMVVLKGGLSSGYKKFITDKGLTDELTSYKADSVALIQISGTSIHNNKAVQVDAAARSLNSMDCFFLQSGSSIFTWHGKQCTFEQQHLAAKVAEFLKKYIEMAASSEQFGLSSNVPLACSVLMPFQGVFGVPVEIDRPHNVHNDSISLPCCDGLVLVRNTNELFIEHVVLICVLNQHMI
uniref:Gelsolin-like domain-containing protein n=1 Tax=Fagus sylvatica TaxID=28930 RepID=A0A2N9IUP4_FAGSY